MAKCSNCDHPKGCHIGDGCGVALTVDANCPCPLEWGEAREPFRATVEIAKALEGEEVPDIPSGDDARNVQVGGAHYRKFAIQPWDIWEEYELDGFLAMVIKYVLRAGHKGSKLEDLKKARHTLDRAIEIEEGKA